MVLPVWMASLCYFQCSLRYTSNGCHWLLYGNMEWKHQFRHFKASIAETYIFIHPPHQGGHSQVSYHSLSVLKYKQWVNFCNKSPGIGDWYCFKQIPTLLHTNDHVGDCTRHWETYGRMLAYSYTQQRMLNAKYQIYNRWNLITFWSDMKVWTTYHHTSHLNPKTMMLKEIQSPYNLGQCNSQ